MLSNFTPLALRLKERSGSVAVDDSEANGCDNSALIGTLEFSLTLFRRNSCMRSPSTPADCEEFVRAGCLLDTFLLLVELSLGLVLSLSAAVLSGFVGS